MSYARGRPARARRCKRTRSQPDFWPVRRSIQFGSIDAYRCHADVHPWSFLGKRSIGCCGALRSQMPKKSPPYPRRKREPVWVNSTFGSPDGAAPAGVADAAADDDVAGVDDAEGAELVAGAIVAVGSFAADEVVIAVGGRSASAPAGASSTSHA